MAACFAALVLHTLAYADFLEDPETWTLLGIGVALACGARAGAVPRDRRRREMRGLRRQARQASARPQRACDADELEAVRDYLKRLITTGAAYQAAEIVAKGIALFTLPLYTSHVSRENTAPTRRC